MNMRMIAMTAVLAGASLCGCAYGNARLADLQDVVSASAFVGPGAVVDLQCTSWIRVGGGTIAGGHRYGVGFGKAYSSEDVRLARGGIAPIFFYDELSERRSKRRFGKAYVLAWGIPLDGDTGDIISPLAALRPKRDASFWDVGFCLHLGYAGVSFHFKLDEFLDLLLGLGTLDIRGDDGKKR